VTIQKTINNLKTDSSREDCKAILVDMLNRAVESDLIIRNVALSVKTTIDSKEREEKRVLTTDEINLLYEASKKGRLYPIFVIALNTGMRIGEIIGLTWDCIDFEKGIIHVQQTLCYISNNGNAIYEFHPPKSKAGRRNIPMTKLVRDVLLEQKMWKDEIKTRFEPQSGFEDLVFTSKTNRPLNATNIKDSIIYLVKRINDTNPELEFKHFTHHCLRHTFASNCISNGMRPKTLQKLLGHNSLQMTMDLYCHVLDDTLKEELGAFNEMV